MLWDCFISSLYFLQAFAWRFRVFQVNCSSIWEVGGFGEYIVVESTRPSVFVFSINVTIYGPTSASSLSCSAWRIDSILSPSMWRVSWLLSIEGRLWTCKNGHVRLVGYTCAFCDLSMSTGRELDFENCHKFKKLRASLRHLFRVKKCRKRLNLYWQPLYTGSTVYFLHIRVLYLRKWILLRSLPLLDQFEAWAQIWNHVLDFQSCVRIVVFHYWKHHELDGQNQEIDQSRCPTHA